MASIDFDKLKERLCNSEEFMHIQTHWNVVLQCGIEENELSVLVRLRDRVGRSIEW